MNPVFTVWMQLMLLLASEVALVVCATALLQRAVESAVWRRTIWQICVLTALTLALSELTGIGRSFPGLFARKPMPTSGTESSISTDPAIPRLADEFRQKVVDRIVAIHQSGPGDALTALRSAPSIRTTSARTDEIPPDLDGNVSVPASLRVLWLALVWFIGTALVLARAVFSRGLLMLLRWSGKVVQEEPLHARVRILKEQLGIRRRIRLTESFRLAGPIAYGLFRPTIGLPAGFAQKFSESRQDVMLAHELAHLAACDPLWHLLADMVAAVLWWHPLIWWARRKLRGASETAADEASLLVADGPGVLAECLVELGGQLTRPRWTNSLGVAGFRSGLGRRVERLLHLRGRSWTPHNRLCVALARSLGPVALVVITILCTAWVAPQALTKGETMKAIEQTWKRSLAAFALLTALNADNNIALAAEKPGPAAEPKPTAGFPVDETAVEQKDSSSVHYNRLMMERYGLIPKGQSTAANEPASVSPGKLTRQGSGTAKNEKSDVETKLEGIILDEVMFDGLPLTEVLRFLSEESRKRDSEKKGINFLINPNVLQTGPASVIDATGTLSRVPAPEPLEMDSVIVQFNLPLRDVRLKDVLNAVVRVANKPIAYSVEEYGVVLSADPEGHAGSTLYQPQLNGSVPLEVRTFRVDTNNFLAGLESAFGIQRTDLDVLLSELQKQESTLATLLAQYTDNSPFVVKQRSTIASLKRQIETSNSGQAGRPNKIQSALRKLLTQLGINLDSPGKTVFYNDLTGIVMVRATHEDLEIVKAAIETLGGTGGEFSTKKEFESSQSAAELMRQRYGLAPRGTDQP
jgi:beta-lactamase regulating signal transducer with metallopeptidase domain